MSGDGEMTGASLSEHDVNQARTFVAPRFLQDSLIAFRCNTRAAFAYRMLRSFESPAPSAFFPLQTHCQQLFDLSHNHEQRRRAHPSVQHPCDCTHGLTGGVGL